MCLADLKSKAMVVCDESTVEKKKKWAGFHASFEGSSGSGGMRAVEKKIFLNKSDT